MCGCEERVAWSVGLCQMGVQQGCVGAHATWLVCARGGAQSCECRGPGPCPACSPPPGLGQLCCCPCSSFPREGDGASSEGTTPHIVASPLPRSNPTSPQVITAQQLPKLNNKKSSIVDPFVRVEIHGVRADCSSKQTEYKLNNGFNPRWEETLSFQLWVPELALVRFVVEDYDTTSCNDFVGQFTLPFTSLREGYRHIHLRSRDGASLAPATLFVHIKSKKI
ncbi:unnamed protein product [Caretta caretta]